jgi:hypothetical protein
MHHSFTCYSSSTCLWLISMTNLAIMKCSAANGNLFTAHHIFLIQNYNHPVNLSLYFVLCMKKPNQPSHIHICPTFQYSGHCHCFAHSHVHSLTDIWLTKPAYWHWSLCICSCGMCLWLLQQAFWLPHHILVHVHQSSSCVYSYLTFRTTFMSP